MILKDVLNMCNIKYHIFSYIIFVVFLSPNKKEWSREAPLFYLYLIYKSTAENPGY